MSNRESPEKVASWAFVLTVVGVIAWVVAAFIIVH